MDMFNRLQHAALISGAFLLLSASVAVHADDIQDANRLFKQGRTNQAMEKVNGILAGKPKDAQARFLKGLILTEQNKINEAIKVFSALTEDYPNLPEPYNNLAVLFASQNQYEKAKLALEMAIRTHPSYATAHENLGDIYAKLASQAYDRALQLDRNNNTTKTKLAMIQDLFATETRGKTAPARSKPAPIQLAAKAPPPPAIKPAPAKPAPAKPAAVTVASSASSAPAAAAQPAAAVSGAIQQTVNAWAAAWSSQNVAEYLSFYAPDFHTPKGQSRKSWENLRKKRLTNPKWIKVGISKLSVDSTDSTHATAKFLQAYKASHFSVTGWKTLKMVSVGGKWMIQEEHSE